MVAQCWLVSYLLVAWGATGRRHGSQLADQSQVDFPVVQSASKPFLVLEDAGKPLRPVSSTDAGL